MPLTPLQRKEIAEDYQSSLLDLTFNSKALINTLTEIAGENIEAAYEIVNVIFQRISQVV